MKRWMALDIGEKRIGVAVSDPSGTIAQGVAVITRTGKQNKDLRRLVELFQEYQCTGLVIGLPLHMNGRAGEEAEKIKEFGVLLGEKCGVTPVFWDERLTTVQAERSLLQMDLSRRRRRQVIDQVAAAILLESFLRSHNPPGE
ncbi:MAG: Holliday junction resolvase RuvX [Firmicutes bacterium]|jgi:putative Holliday junction resolvase|nr:Holliday junction resolvase RuvX [Bacillota bacterium]